MNAPIVQHHLVIVRDVLADLRVIGCADFAELVSAWIDGAPEQFIDEAARLRPMAELLFRVLLDVTCDRALSTIERRMCVREALQMAGCNFSDDDTGAR